MAKKPQLITSASRWRDWEAIKPSELSKEDKEIISNFLHMIRPNNAEKVIVSFEIREPSNDCCIPSFRVDVEDGVYKGYGASSNFFDALYMAESKVNQSRIDGQQEIEK